MVLPPSPSGMNRGHIFHKVLERGVARETPNLLSIPLNQLEVERSPSLSQDLANEGQSLPNG